MQIKGLIWLDKVIYKLLSKHKVGKDEVKEVLNSKPRFRFVEKGHRKGENVYAAMGQIQAGRYLIVFLSIRRIDMR